MRRGEELKLAAMEKEHKRLSLAADRAKKETEECTNIGKEIIKIHEEFSEIVKSGEHGKVVLKKLDNLTKRRDRANKILKKDLVKLIEKECSLTFDRDELWREMGDIKLINSIRSGK